MLYIYYWPDLLQFCASVLLMTSLSLVNAMQWLLMCKRSSMHRRNWSTTKSRKVWYHHWQFRYNFAFSIIQELQVIDQRRYDPAWCPSVKITGSRPRPTEESGWTKQSRSTTITVARSRSVMEDLELAAQKYWHHPPFVLSCVYAHTRKLHTSTILSGWEGYSNRQYTVHMVKSLSISATRSRTRPYPENVEQDNNNRPTSRAAFQGQLQHG